MEKNDVELKARLELAISNLRNSKDEIIYNAKEMHLYDFLFPSTLEDVNCIRTLDRICAVFDRYNGDGALMGLILDSMFEHDTFVLSDSKIGKVPESIIAKNFEDAIKFIPKKAILLSRWFLADTGSPILGVKPFRIPQKKSTIFAEYHPAEYQCAVYCYKGKEELSIQRYIIDYKRKEELLTIIYDNHQNADERRNIVLNFKKENGRWTYDDSNQNNMEKWKVNKMEIVKSLIGMNSILDSFAALYKDYQVPEYLTDSPKKRQRKAF